MTGPAANPSATPPAAAPAPAAPPTVRTGLVLDAQDLNATAAFWTERFDFREIARRRAGLLTEERDLLSPMFPSMLLTLRSCAPRPGRGCVMGGLRLIVLYVPDLARFARERLQGVSFITPPPPEGQPVTALSMEDPSRYRLELRDGPRAGS